VSFKQTRQIDTGGKTIICHYFYFIFCKIVRPIIILSSIQRFNGSGGIDYQNIPSLLLWTKNSQHINIKYILLLTSHDRSEISNYNNS
jgi:hypothetical protein